MAYLHTGDRHIFGILIGIDQYESSTMLNLSGAVADSQAVQQFFYDKLNILPENLTVLRDRSATREAIINALHRLKDDVRIKHGDAIFIYFAGHGGEIDAPKGWEAGGKGKKIQVIIPHDYYDIKGGNKVPAIPDRTIGTLIERIAESKGNNITVVFDCCHSASGTRSYGGEGSTIGVRFGEVDATIHNEQLDSNLLGVRATLSPPRHLGLQSHVLLSACKEGELAREIDGCGLFIRALLEILCNSDIPKMKYRDIMKKIAEKDLRGQTPQCEGVHQNRYIFSLENLPPPPTIYTPICEWDSKSQKYLYAVNAGSAHGLASDDEITIYPSEAAIGKHTLGETLTVGMVNNFSSTLYLPTGIEALSCFASFSVAVKSSQGQRPILYLRLHAQGDTLNLLRNTVAAFPNICTDSENAHLSVVEARNEGGLLVQITDPRVTEHGRSAPWFRPRHGATIALEEFPKILVRALHYQWELDRTNPCHPFRSGIDVEFYELQESMFFPGHYDLSPRKLSNLCQNGEIRLEASNDTTNMYGIKVTNKTDHVIYPQAYYFDSELFSIETLYEPPFSSVDPDVPLSQEGGTLTIGYGSGGWHPFSPPMLQKGQTIHVGFLKLFLSSQLVSSRQPTNSTSHYYPRGLIYRPQARQSTSRAQPTWDVIVIPVVQHLNLNGYVSSCLL